MCPAQLKILKKKTKKKKILKNSRNSKLAQVKPYFLKLFIPFYFQTESLLFPHVNGRYPLIQGFFYTSCCGIVASPGFHSQTRVQERWKATLQVLLIKPCCNTSVCLQFLWISQAIQHGNRVCAMTWLKWRLEYCFWKQPDESWSKWRTF